MIRNYIKIAWRNLVNFKSYGLINLVGLLVGTVCCLGILAFVQSQFGFEEEFEGYQQIFKVTTTNKHSGTADFVSITASPGIGPALQRDFEEIGVQTRVVDLGNNEFLMKPEKAEQAVFEKMGYLADSTFFDVFSFHLLLGDRKTALDKPNTIVLSTALKDKLFGEQNPLGKAIEVSNGDDHFIAQVTGVLDDKGIKTHLKPNYIISMPSTGMGSYVAGSSELGTNNFVHTYLKVHPNTTLTSLESKLPGFLEKNAGDYLRSISMDKSLGLLAIKDINLRSSEYSNPLGKTSNIMYLYLLMGIAFFIQLMACINYINLTTAQATKRAKEIGVRKVNGAASKALVYQFLIESIMISIFSVLLALPILIIMLPSMNELLNGSLILQDILSLKMLITIVLLGLVTGLISGSYPAMYLSVMDPIRILKQSFKTGKRAFLFRNGLVVFQFVMVFLLIYAVSVITNQITHLNKKDLGFSQYQKLVVPLKTSKAMENYQVLKNDLENLSSVEEVTGTEFIPSENIWYDQLLFPKGRTSDDGQIVNLNLARENFFQTMDIKLLKGRVFPEADGTQMVVNRTFLKTFEIDMDEAIGMQFHNNHMEAGDSPYEIVGVIEDYNFLSLKNAIVPVATFYDNDLNNLIVKFNASNTSDLLSSIESIWLKHNPEVPFQFSFLDDKMASIYAEEQRLKKVSNTFAFLAIVISLLGIWGLVSFTTQQRTKEIGVRKVLGASVFEITRLLSLEFLVLVAISVSIGIPIGIYAMNLWLDSYTYRIENTVGLIFFAVVCTLVVCLLTVIYKTMAAAKANPIHSIKSE